MKSFLLLVVVLVFFIANSCNVSTNAPTGENEVSIPNENASNYIVLKADISDVVKPVTKSLQTLSNRARGSLYYIFSVELSTEVSVEEMLKNASLISIESTNMEISLEKGHYYLIGIVEKSDEQGLKVLGIIGDRETGNIVFPVSDEAASELDLGKLIYDPENGLIYPSQVSISNIAERLGSDLNLLSQLGRVNYIFKRFINIDVNMNGVLDWNEDPPLNTAYFIKYNLAYFKSEEFARYVFADLSFKISKEYLIDYFGSLEDLTAKFVYQDRKREIRYIFDEHEFIQFTVRVEFPSLGYVNLIISNGSKSLNLRYYVTGFDPRNVIEGILVPLMNIDVYPDGRISGLKWKWVINTANEIQEANDELLNLMLIDKGIFIHLDRTPLFLGNEHNELLYRINWKGKNAFIDLYDENLWLFKNPFNLIYANTLYTLTWGDNIGVGIRYNFKQDFEDDIEENEAFNLKELRGFWYNLFYNSETWCNDGDVKFPEYKWPLVIFYEDGGALKYQLVWHFFLNREDYPPYQIDSMGSVNIDEDDKRLTLIDDRDGQIRYEFKILRLDSEYLILQSLNEDSDEIVVYRKYITDLTKIKECCMEFKPLTDPEDMTGLWKTPVEEYFPNAPYYLEFSDIKPCEEGYCGKVKIYGYWKEFVTDGEIIFLKDDYSKAVINLNVPPSVPSHTPKSIKIRIYVSGDMNTFITSYYDATFPYIKVQ